MFSESFDTYIELNLELPADREIFANFREINSLFNLILLKKQVKSQSGRTLLFIDEIQYSATAMQALRYFHEEMPELYVIAAGSLLELYLFREKVEISVGRVEYRWLYPMNFEEYLQAAGQNRLLELLSESTFPDYAESSLREQFLQYALIGGMPEVVKTWLETKNIMEVRKCQEAILTAYRDDILKYSHTSDQSAVLQHIFNTAFSEVGRQISFEGFGGSSFKSQSVRNAFIILEKTSFFSLLYPYTSTILPTVPQRRKRPKLLMLDTGLLNYQANVMEEYFTAKRLDSVFKGIAMEHIVGQMLLSIQQKYRFELSFWKRDARSSTAEVDYVIIYRGKMIPIEVKAGKSGSLKSLLLFMDNAEHGLAIRIYDGEIGKELLSTPNGKSFTLLNLHLGQTMRIPYYIDAYLDVI